jgi:DNA-binding transcriptional ArsR family regulator
VRPGFAPELAKFRMFLYAQVMPSKVRQSREAEAAGRTEALRRFKAEVFRVLAHPTRIHIVECLRKTELPVSNLLEQVRVEPANLSQHLGVLRSTKLVVTRKEGNQVFYSLRDPLLIEVLDSMRRYFQAHLEESLAMLADLDQS